MHPLSVTVTLRKRSFFVQTKALPYVRGASEASSPPSGGLPITGHSHGQKMNSEER